MKKNLQAVQVIELTKEFIRKSRNGRRRYGNGRRISASTIQNYEALLRHLMKYQASLPEPLRLYSENRLTEKQFLAEKRYWKKFFLSFTQYLHQLGCFDNYVGMHMKNLRAVMKFAQDEKMIGTGAFRKLLYVTKEEIPIVSLTPERLHFLIHNEAFRAALDPVKQLALDVIVLGCTVALRFSDLVRIKRSNIEHIGGSHYLSVSSEKTKVVTRVKLSGYALKIIERNLTEKRMTVFPVIRLSWFNAQVRSICERAGWTEEFGKYRLRNGRTVEIRNSRTGKSYRFCDLASSHMMRRTAITTMLINGVPELIVRRISGHTASSLAFQRYVNLVQSYLDREIDRHYAIMGGQSPDALAPGSDR